MRFHPVKSLRRRLSRLVGLPNIYGRLDSMQTQISQLGGQRDLLDQTAEYVFLLELRMKDYVHTQKAQTLTEIEAQNESLIQATQIRLEEINRHLQEMNEALVRFINDRSAQLSDIINERVDATNRHLQEMNEALVRFINDRSAQLSDIINERFMQVSLEHGDGVRAKVSHLTDQLTELKRYVADIQFTSRVVSQQAARPVRDAENVFVSNDALYQAFEDRFRGAEEVIRARQASYLEYFRAFTADDLVVDIGCGRGEWLEVLREHGLRGRGIDVNPVTVNRCREKGLTVDLQDGLEFLTDAVDNSISGVTLFQVIEHLDLDSLIQLVRESRRVLKPGGVLLAEFPNIQCLSVGANTFWLDPTHVRPLHPLLVEFIISSQGFSSTSLRYPSDAGVNGQSLGGESAFLSSPDVAVIAVK